MKKYNLAIIIIFLTLLAKAQEGQFYNFTLYDETPLKHKVYVGKFTDNGSTGKLDVNEIIKEHFAEAMGAYGNGNRKADNCNVWSKKDFIVPVESANEAGVVMSGSYTFNQTTEVDEKSLMERSSNYAYKIPYFEVRPKNKTELTVVFEFKYSDGNVVTDTAYKEFVSEKKDGKGLVSLDAQKGKTRKFLERELSDLTKVVGVDLIWYKFPKVKVKDKALKTEYKGAKDLLKENKIKELGKLYKKIYETTQAKEAAKCIAMCYEILGNYPKAEEYHQKMPDFATKTRMKQNMEVFNYLKEMGCELELAEF